MNNFHPLEVAGHSRETQIRVGENFNSCYNLALEGLTPRSLLSTKVYFLCLIGRPSCINNSHKFNQYASNLCCDFNLTNPSNFHSLEVVSHGSDAQLQVTEKSRQVTFCILSHIIISH